MSEEMKAPVTLKQAKEALQVVVDWISQGNSLSLKGGLKLSLVRKPGREARNPKTDERITVPEKTVLKVKVLPSLKKTVESLPASTSDSED